MQNTKISIDTIIKVLERKSTIPNDDFTYEEINDAIDKAIDLLAEKKGNWIDSLDSDYFKCSRCGCSNADDSEYCPSCGAYMK